MSYQYLGPILICSVIVLFLMRWLLKSSVGELFAVACSFALLGGVSLWSVYTPPVTPTPLPVWEEDVIPKLWNYCGGCRHET